MWNWNNSALRTLKTLCLDFCHCLPSLRFWIIPQIATCLLKQLIYSQNWKSLLQLVKAQIHLSINIRYNFQSPHSKHVNWFMVISWCALKKQNKTRLLYISWKVNRKWIHEFAHWFINNGMVLHFQISQCILFFNIKDFSSKCYYVFSFEYFC